MVLYICHWAVSAVAYLLTNYEETKISPLVIGFWIIYWPFITVFYWTSLLTFFLHFIFDSQVRERCRSEWAQFQARLTSADQAYVAQLEKGWLRCIYYLSFPSALVLFSLHLEECSRVWFLEMMFSFRDQNCFFCILHTHKYTFDKRKILHLFVYKYISSLCSIWLVYSFPVVQSPSLTDKKNEMLQQWNFLYSLSQQWVIATAVLLYIAWMVMYLW